MGDEVDLHTVPLTALTYEARILLSCLLNTTKILLSDGPDKLPRDWRGLASLINISSEIANSYDKDKTTQVLEYWIRLRDGSATIGKLLEFVQRIDRYDIFDDFIDLSSKGKLVVNQQPPRNYEIAIRGCQAVVPREEDDIEENLITFDDKIHGAPQFYHAYILFAHEDRPFVDEMLIRMRERNFKMCIEDDLLPDHATTYGAVSRLISSDRCLRIILIYSPDFLTSPANNFYMDYAQAIGIEMRRPKIVPVMYRSCQLPPQVTFYHKLYYRPQNNKASYDFWDRLSFSLYVTPTQPRLNGITSPYSASVSSLNITEVQTSNQSYTNGVSHPQHMLALPGPSGSVSSISMNSINSIGNGISEDSQQLNGTTSSGEIRKKKSRGLKDFLRFRKPSSKE